MSAEGQWEVAICGLHTASAGEMVAAFAAENNLATIAGTKTAGRLIPGSGFHVGHGYMLILPKAEYVTWREQRYEGRGIIPNVQAARTLSAFGTTSDRQLEIATDIVRSM